MPKSIFRALTAAEKKVFIASLIVFLISLLLRTASAFEAQTEKVPSYGGEYKEGFIGQPAFINPILAGADIDRYIAALLYKPLGSIAESIQTESPPNEYKIFTVKIKQNLVWEDNTPLNADDVIFTLQTIQDENANSPLYHSWRGVIAERVSEIQVKFILRNPYVFFSGSLKGLPVIPRHIFGEIPSANLKLSSYNLEPIGNGPYKFEGFKKRRDGFINEYRLTVNENYNGERPFIRKIIFRFYKDENERIDSFNNRRVDGLGGIDPKNLAQIKTKHILHQTPMPRYYAVFFNQNLKPELKNINLRLALNRAVDKNYLIENIFGGFAVPTNGPIVPGFPGYDASAFTETGYDPEKAKQAIGELKLKEDFALNLIVPQVEFLVKTAEFIKSAWENTLGIKTNLITLSPSDVVNEVLKSRNYEAVLFGNILQSNPDLFSFWHSSERFHPGLNLALYSNAKADQLIEEIRQTKEADIRQQKLSTLQGVITQDLPAVFLCSPRYIYVMRDVFGFEAEYLVTPADRFSNIEKWYLKTKRVFK